jgi:hypothetical protein
MLHTMNASLRTSLKRLCCALVVSTCCYAAAESETLFNGSYQIELREGGHVSTTKSQFLLREGEKARARMEPTGIEMWVSPVSDVEFDFHLVVTIDPSATSLKPARLDKVYRGRFGVPLELGASDRELTMKGSVAVLRYRPVASAR